MCVPDRHYQPRCLPKEKTEDHSPGLGESHQDPKQLNLAPGITDLTGEHSNVGDMEAEGLVGKKDTVPFLQGRKQTCTIPFPNHLSLSSGFHNHLFPCAREAELQFHPLLSLDVGHKNPQLSCDNPPARFPQALPCLGCPHSDRPAFRRLSFEHAAPPASQRSTFLILRPPTCSGQVIFSSLTNPQYRGLL